MVANAFYINNTFGDFMGNETHTTACNATVGSSVDGRDGESVLLLAMIALAPLSIGRSLSDGSPVRWSPAATQLLWQEPSCFAAYMKCTVVFL